MITPPIVRFAPSPTGYLHVGNVRTALVNFLFAKKQGGQFILRLDDTDTDRSRPEFEAAIKEDMQWLGFVWDDFKKQSYRYDRYENAKQQLMASGRLYPCFETPVELDLRRKMQSGRGLPPIYDRSALKLTDAQKAGYIAEGRQPHYRFLLQDKPIVWQDMIRGEVRFEGTHISDPVLIRADGVPLYTLASVVDDVDMQISHILRGEDHVTNTAVQMQIFEALGCVAPVFGHLALLKTKEGELSKRVGGNDIRGLREGGILPMAVNSLLAKIGTSDAVEPFSTMESLVAAFNITKFGRATANYDMGELERVNQKLMHHLSFEQVQSHIPFAEEAFWLAVRDNIKHLSEVKLWWDIIHGEAGCAIDQEFAAQALQLLPSGDWSETTWGIWTKAIAEKTGKKGKELFMPLRLALTGMEHGPEMKLILPMIGAQKVASRLQTVI